MSGQHRPRRTTAAVTLSDVAQHAGVSLATASRVLNGSLRTPAAAMVDKVQASAAELGYVANAQAQALARSATGLVGLVVHDIVDPYFANITRGAQRYARGRDAQVLLAGSERSELAELEAIAALVAYRTEGIILAGSRRRTSDRALAQELGRYIRNGGRVVTLGRSKIPGARHLQIEHRAGAADLVRALIASGVSEFAILAGPPALDTARFRVEGYRAALAAAGLDPLAVVHGDFNRDGGLAAALECWPRLEDRPGPVCVLAVNDVMALGALTGFRSLGLAVPADVRIAGFDDIPHLQDVSPALTTVRLPLEVIGEKAAELALSAKAGGPVVITGQVILRESTNGKDPTDVIPSSRPASAKGGAR